MAHAGRPTAEVELTDDERDTLERWARRPKSAQALALRCRIVLACADADRTNGEIAVQLGITPATVGKWRRRFVDHRLEGLHDEPRPGVPRSITDDDVERVIVKTLEEVPDRRHPLVHPVHGQSHRHEPVRCQPHLAGLRTEAPPAGDLQAVARPLVHRESARRCGPLSEPSRGRPGAVRRREDSGAGPRPHRAGAATPARGSPSGPPTTTCATAPPTSTPPWTWPRARSSPT